MGTIGDSTIYFLGDRKPEPFTEPLPEGSIVVRFGRTPQPCFGVVVNNLVASGSVDSIEQAIKTLSSGDDLLSDAIEYKLIRDRIKAQLKDKATSIMT